MVFMCENDPVKVKYLTQAYGDALCFLDMVELKHGRALEHRSGLPLDVPKVRSFLFGFRLVHFTFLEGSNISSIIMTMF